MCSNSTIDEALRCAFAATPPPTVASTTPLHVVPAQDTPLFSAPSVLQGSRFSDRFELNPDFLKVEQLIETVSNLSEEDKINLGYTLEDLVLECRYADSECSLR